VNFLGVVHLNVPIPPLSNCSSSKTEIPPRRNIFEYENFINRKFSYSKILELEGSKERFLTFFFANKMKRS